MVEVATRTLAEWTGRGTRVGEVLKQLEGLRRTGQRSLASRTSVVTLVVRAPSAVDAWEAVSTVHRFGGHHPARSIVLVPLPDGPPRLDARVTLTAAESGGHHVWFEDVVLSVSGPAAHRLGSLVEPFALSDLPLVVWYLGQAPEASDDLLLTADAVLVDSKMAIAEEGGDAGDDGPGGAMPDRASLDAVASLFGRVPVLDLAWIRLRPWRELLASMVDGAAFRPALDDLTSATVTGKAGARALLGGWLSSRLRLPPGALHLSAGRHASVRLVGRIDGHQATFAVERMAGERLVRATASVEDGPSFTDVLALPEPDPSWALAQALSGLRCDLVYEGAVRAGLG
ncbi:MAG: glucose-6-phosphate dehydrogenase assembly protein OpcA [Acidimicrobiales bacterium]